jgi:hypothetical protein
MVIFFRHSSEITPNLSSIQNKQIQETAKRTEAVMLVRAVGNRSPMKGKTTYYSSLPLKCQAKQKDQH